jgi:phytoene synthase
LLHGADDLSARARDGIAWLPWTCRPAIHAASLLYAEIGHQVRRNRLDSVSRRAVVPASRKLAVFARVPSAAALSRRRDSAPPLDQARFLINAVEARPLAATGRRTLGQRFDERFAWVLDLFIRLEQRERLRYSERP